MAINKDQVIDQLNRILECELAGVVRYTHYSMMIFGFSRIPIVKWFQDEARESLQHAQQAGEMVTRLGGHPSLAIGDLLETHAHDIVQILRETLQAEHYALGLYTKLLKLVEGQSVALEEYARRTGTPTATYRLPGIFGKWCRPNYNSVVATFCHNIGRDLPIAISDPSHVIAIVHVILARLRMAISVMDVPRSGRLALWVCRGWYGNIAIPRCLARPILR